MPKEKSITIKLPFGRPLHTLFCDGYAIRKFGDFTDLDFLCERSGEALSIRMATEFLTSQRQDFLGYLKKVGLPTSRAPAQVRVPQATLVVADTLGMASHKKVGEIAFHAISWLYAVKEDPGDDDLSRSRAAYFVASIRCSLDLQLHWINALYADENETGES